MKLSAIKNITKSKNKVYDITVENNHNFFCNNHLIHNCDYRGEILAVLINLGQESVMINKGDRIAQIIFEYFASPTILAVSNLTVTQRNTGGFGSTGGYSSIDKISRQKGDLGVSLDHINNEILNQTTKQTEIL